VIWITDQLNITSSGGVGGSNAMKHDYSDTHHLPWVTSCVPGGASANNNTKTLGAGGS